MRRWIMAWLSLLTLFGAATLHAQTLDTPTGTSWRLLALDGDPLVANTVITLHFNEEGGVSGSASCNGYFATADLEANALRFADIGATLMACEIEGINAQESRYLDMLQTVQRYELNEGVLTLTTDAGTTLRYAPLFAGTTWRLEFYGVAGETPMLPDTALTLSFSDATQVTGDTGCNRFGSDYTVSDNEIAFDTIFSSRRACLDAEQADQERAYLDGLTDARQWWWNAVDNQLRIRYGDAEDALVFVRVDALAETEWQLIRRDGQAPISEHVPTLSFDDAGMVNGSSGCNTFFSRYQVAGDALMFEEIATTEMDCLEDGVMEQEAAFYDALARTTTHLMREGRLTLSSASGQLVFAPAQN